MKFKNVLAIFFIVIFISMAFVISCGDDDDDDSNDDSVSDDDDDGLGNCNGDTGTCFVECQGDDDSIFGTASGPESNALEGHDDCEQWANTILCGELIQFEWVQNCCPENLSSTDECIPEWWGHDNN